MAGLVYQRLVPVLCPNCKVALGKASEEHKNEVLPDQTYDRLLKVVNQMDDIHIRGKGCAHCKHVGFTDQTVAAEVVVTDHILLKHVRAGSIAEAYQYWREALHGKSYVQDAISKMEHGLLDPHMTEIRLGVPLSFEPDPKPKV